MKVGVKNRMVMIDAIDAGVAILLHKYGCRKTLSLFQSSWKLVKVSNHLSIILCNNIVAQQIAKAHY